MKTEEMFVVVEKTLAEFVKATVELNLDTGTTEAMVRAAVGLEYQRRLMASQREYMAQCEAERAKAPQETKQN